MAERRATLLGDVVDSRHHDDRQALHDALTEVLSQVQERCASDDGPALTVGDEFQASYPTVGTALEAVLTTRALAAPLIDLRFGVGRGEVTVLDRATGIQDGPGWWAAREAIDDVRHRATRTGWASLRCAFRSAEGPDDVTAAVDAALVCQDLVLGSFDSTDWSILRGLMEQRTQAEIAAALGVSRQAVQQRRKAAGMPMLLEAVRRLAELE